MISTFKDLLVHQFEAVLCTVNTCVARCPPVVWTARVGKLTFDQVAFHALFYTD